MSEVIDSEKLGHPIIIQRLGEPVLNVRNATIYYQEELAILGEKTDAQLKSIDTVKQVFGPGTIVRK